MLWFLRLLFAAIVVSMVATASWAGAQCGLFSIPHEVIGHPWFIATLFDAYFAFIAFFVWVAWKEQRVGAGVLWFVSIILLGNMAIGAYMLRELFSIRSSAELPQLFARRNPGHLVLAGVLTVLSIAVYGVAAL